MAQKTYCISVAVNAHVYCTNDTKPINTVWARVKSCVLKARVAAVTTVL
jgi:hypothetical protein